MDYRVASNIRGKSLSSLITDRITSGGSVGSSIKGAISDKLKAKGTGIKEKFDPMNIARAMTGGGKLATAILGKITGRSQSDINYFAGDKKKSSSYTRMPSVGQVPSEGFGGSAVEVLNKMLSFMQKNREDDLKRKQISMSFEEERQSEEQRRHGDFLKVLKDFTSVGGTTTMVKKESEKEESLFDKIANLFSKGAFLARIIPFLVNPLTLTLGAVLAAAYGLQKVADFIPNASILSPLEAQAALGGSERDIEKLGGYDFLSKRITEGPEEAQKTLDDFAEGRISFQELQKRGGETKLKEIASQKGLEVPAQRQTQTTNNVPARPTGTGLEPELKRKQWDEKYGENYNFDGTPKVTKVPDTGTTPAAAATPVPGTTIPVSTVTPVPETTSPVPANPPSSAVVGKIQENNDLNMQATMTAGAPSSPTVSVNNSSTSAPDQTVTATATTRDDTPILDLVLKRAKAQV
jgi:hypothetical protein